MKTSFLPATLLCDFYKVSHREQYPAKTEVVYSTWTPRTSRKEGIDEVVVFGIQSFIMKYLCDFFNENFFSQPKVSVIEEYRRVIKYCLGKEDVDTSHIEALHDLGYLPVLIKALPEGTLCPIRVPMLTIENTVPEFFWVTNYLETLMSCELWQPMTSATIALQYRIIAEKYAMETSGDVSGIPFQCHDFSMRGMGSLETACTSGAGHLLSFVGTDTIPSILYMEEYYGADIEKELVGTSIPASEHSVICTYGNEKEFETFKHLACDVYPTGFFSVVSDTWDLWKVLTDYLPRLKPEIMARDGRMVIRPDSGNPADILCGNPNGKTEAEKKGVIELLWDTFGGVVNDLGFKQLDPHIGAIYGDSITVERMVDIFDRLKAKGFASTNVVFGVGSYTYQYNTRDTFGFALKATYAKVDGEERLLFKDPVTDDGTKKSQRGKVAVVENADGKLSLVDGLGGNQIITNDELRPLFIDGEFVAYDTLADIRERINDTVAKAVKGV